MGEKMTGEIERAGHFAGRLLRQGLASLCIVGASFFVLPWIANGDPYGNRALWVVFIALALITLGLSLYLCFDAALFKLFASGLDATAGGEAVDAFLASTKLREQPTFTRSLDERMAGAMRLIWLQRAALLAFLLALVLMMLGKAWGLM